MERKVTFTGRLGASYPRVRKLLRHDPSQLLRAMGAVDRDGVAVKDLVIDVGGLRLHTEITLAVADYDEIARPLPVSTARLHCRSLDHPHLIPPIEAMVDLYPLSSAETGISVLASYQTRHGTMGAVADVMLVHRALEACLRDTFAAMTGMLQSAVRRDQPLEV